MPKRKITDLKRDFRKGDGEYIGFALGMVGICFLIWMLASIFTLCMATSQLEYAVDLISRDIVTCESLEDAMEKARDEAQTYLSMCNVVEENSIDADIYYAPGSSEDHREWTKGNFVEVSITAKLRLRNPFVDSRRVETALVMIEHSS